MDEKAVEAAQVAVVREADIPAMDFLNGMQMAAPMETVARVDVGAAKADMEQFLYQMLSNTLFDEMVGYIWTLE